MNSSCLKGRRFFYHNEMAPAFCCRTMRNSRNPILKSIPRQMQNATSSIGHSSNGSARFSIDCSIRCRQTKFVVIRKRSSIPIDGWRGKGGIRRKKGASARRKGQGTFNYLVFLFFLLSALCLCFLLFLAALSRRLVPGIELPRPRCGIFGSI